MTKLEVTTDSLDGFQRTVYVCVRCRARTGFDAIPNPAKDYQPRCVNCFEVEGRLVEYLKAEPGRRFVAGALAAATELWGRKPREGRKG